MAMFVALLMLVLETFVLGFAVGLSVEAWAQRRELDGNR
jgi:hypothetical protein